ncbi:MAG: hypothetical protein Q7R94_00155 [bacterium]|nr:hypothetical protein [bacterium]
MSNRTKKRAPINTSEEMRRGPMGFYLDAVIAGGGKAIEMQEAQGQRSLVASETLPTDIRKYDGYDTKAILEVAGVKFLGTVEGDDMFQYAEFPKGWKKVPTDHSMWSKLVDENGRERASIFYKAASYDRSAHMTASRRFGLRFDYARFDRTEVGVTDVTDGDKVVYTTVPIPGNGKKSYEVSGLANQRAAKWLNRNYPDWKNASAYWD